MAKKKTDVVTQQEVEPKAKATDYKVEVTLLGETLKFNTDNIAETLFNIKPVKISGKVVIKVTKGKKSFEKALNVFQARRLFINRLTATILEKNIKLNLD